MDMSLLDAISDLLYQMSAIATVPEEAQEINDLALKGQNLLMDIVSEMIKE